MPLVAFSKTVASIYDAVADVALIPAALKAVADYVGAPSAACLVVNKLTRQVTSRVAWGSHSGSAADYLSHYGKIDPFRVVQEKAACGSLVRLSECLPDSVLRHDECQSAAKFDPGSASNSDPSGLGLGLVPVANRRDPRGAE